MTSLVVRSCGRKKLYLMVGVARTILSPTDTNLPTTILKVHNDFDDIKITIDKHKYKDYIPQST